ncbi:MAG TPA: hypothetical protein ENJ15_05900 [Caldithrix abyssi]|uniref:Uncharacterized protein n=1 Tax=Caldithrix abyssi TaxID=187145 RepID=A0A7V5VF78_CALAY|nr:hypothetical protein [Caldithrix abyssi]
MNKYIDKTLLLILTGITFIGGYAFLRYAYKVTDSTPFTQEIVLIILGTVVTMLITALLLRKQSAVEVEKEQSIKFIDLKTRTYEDLIAKIEEMSLAVNISNRDLIRMQFITHRLAIFSSPEVLEEFQRFLEVLIQKTRDGKISRDDSVSLAESLANLTVKIRADLIGEMDRQNQYSRDKIRKQILMNSSESMELLLKG